MRSLFLSGLASGLLLLVTACATLPVHPGQTVARRRCTACHVEPAPGALRVHGVAELRSLHRERVELTDAEAADLLEWAAGGTE